MHCRFRPLTTHFLLACASMLVYARHRTMDAPSVKLPAQVADLGLMTMVVAEMRERSAQRVVQ